MIFMNWYQFHFINKKTEAQRGAMICSRASKGQIKEFINVYSRYKTTFLRLLFISENHISNSKNQKGVEKEGNGKFYKF